MSYDKQKVIDIALAEEGYLEKETNSNLDHNTANAGDENYTKYARDLAEVKFFNSNKQGHYWCAVFVGWSFWKAYGKEAALKLLCQPTKDNCGAGCKYIRQYFKAKGQWHTSNPQPGDVIVFYNSTKTEMQHTGLVYKVDSSKVYTIEGNTTSASGVVSNGGCVRRKSYRLSYAGIAGYGRPDYGMQSDAEESNNNPTSSTTSSTTSKPASSSKPAASSDTVYTVKKGDNLWNLAKKYLGQGKRYKEIMNLNGLKSDLIKIGQKLKIPKK